MGGERAGTAAGRLGKRCLGSVRLRLELARLRRHGASIADDLDHWAAMTGDTAARHLAACFRADFAEQFSGERARPDFDRADRVLVQALAILKERIL